MDVGEVFHILFISMEKSNHINTAPNKKNNLLLWKRTIKNERLLFITLILQLMDVMLMKPVDPIVLLKYPRQTELKYHQMQGILIEKPVNPLHPDPMNCRFQK